MIVAVTSSGMSLDSQVSLQISDSAYFVLVDTEIMSMVSALLNSPGGEIIPRLREAGVKALLTGSCPEELAEEFCAGGIKVYRGFMGVSVRAEVQSFKEQFPVLS